MPEGEGDDTRADQVCFLRTVQAFQSYATHARIALEARKMSFRQLSDRHIELLGGMPRLEELFADCEAAIDKNQQFLNSVVVCSRALYEGYWPTVPNSPPTAEELRPNAMDMDKVYSTLRQFVRDWSLEGVAERNAVYGPMIKAITNVFDAESRVGKRVLVPGAGLSRLSVDLAALGFSVQGNEFSYHMLIGGHYAMNHLENSDEFEIHPFCEGTLNLFSRRDQLRGISIPDRTAYDMMDEAEEAGREFGQLSMVAGDFTEVFSKPQERGAWDCVATCFFIDTAHNIVQYVEMLWDLLVPGGLWVNCGPLLFHYSDQPGELSVDVSYEELKELVKRVGFELVSESCITTTYANNVQSMKQQLYHAPFFACRKPVGAGRDEASDRQAAPAPPKAA